MSKPIRVLHILQRMEAGGTQALLMNLYRKIDRSKVQFDFLVVYKEKQFYDDEIEKLGGHVYKLSFREDLNLPKFLKDLKNFFNDHKEYSIVHCHAYTIGYFCLKYAYKAGIPIRIAHSHNNETVHNFKYIPKLIMQRLFTIYATDLFACSKEAGKYLFKDRNFEVLNNSIDSSLFIASDVIRNEVRNEIGINDKFVIGHVGRFHEQKNHSFLFEIFLEIKRLKEDAVLILVGSGPLENELRSKVEKLGISKDVIFLGNRSDMYRIYQAMDAFVFPSLFEGLGIVAIEAQAAGIPTICSDRLPDEVNITPLFKTLQLNQKPDIWANEIIVQSSKMDSHRNMQEYVMNSGFDTSKTVGFVQNYYLDKLCKKGIVNGEID